MVVLDGTASANAWIQKLKSSGHLVDVYDLDRITTEKSYRLPLDATDFEEFDKEHGTSYRNHLLAVFIDGDVDTNEIINLYPPCAENFSSESFQPHLMFINLIKQSVLMVMLSGQGSIDSVLLPDSDFALFTEFDYAGVVETLTEALEAIASADYNLVYTEIDEGHIQQADQDGPDADGMYLVGTHGDDGGGITVDELIKAKNNIKNFKNDIEDGLYEFNKYFPMRKIDFNNFRADY